MILSNISNLLEEAHSSSSEGLMVGMPFLPGCDMVHRKKLYIGIVYVLPSLMSAKWYLLVNGICLCHYVIGDVMPIIEQGSL